MNRDITNKINYVLDNWVPPRIRDSRILMSIAVCMAFGPKYKYFMSFKEKVNDMKEDEINYYYEFLADAMGRLNRKTDLKRMCSVYSEPCTRQQCFRRSGRTRIPGRAVGPQGGKAWTC